MHLARIALLSAVWISTAFGQAPTFEKWVPVPQVVDALEAQIKTQPRNWRMLRDVAVVQHLAFSVQVSQFLVLGQPGSINVVLPDRIARGSNGKLDWEMVGKRWSPQILVEYAVGGLVAYERALAIYPQDAELWLGYAALLEDVWAFCFAKPADQFPPEFSKIRVPFLREVYAQAFQLGLLQDHLRGMAGYLNGSVAYPAALGTLRLEKTASPALSPAARQGLEDYTRAVEAKNKWLTFPRCDTPGFSTRRYEIPTLAPGVSN